MPDITQPARTKRGHPKHLRGVQVSPPGAAEPWLGDSTRAGLTWLCRAPPNRGHQVVQSHSSGSGAICPSGHEHRGSGMCQGVLAARAIPWCCWQLVGGTGLCPDGPRFWGATLRDGSWTHPSHVSGGGWELFLLPYSPFPAPVICQPWQYQHWQCHPITTQAGSRPCLPPTCHLPPAPFWGPAWSAVCPCLCLLPHHSLPSVCPSQKTSDKSLSPPSCAYPPDILHMLLSHPSARSYFLPSLPRCLCSFFFCIFHSFLLHLSFFSISNASLDRCLVTICTTASFPPFPSHHGTPASEWINPLFYHLKRILRWQLLKTLPRP